MNEAKQFAAAFDRIGRGVLAELEEMPNEILHWPFPMPRGHSVFELATQLVEESEFWVLEVVGGQSQCKYEQSERRVGATFSDLIMCYNQWLTAVHTVLDELPDEMMNVTIVLPTAYRETFGGGSTTVRDCLLHTLEQSALQIGHIQFMCRLFTDGERALQEVVEERDEWEAIGGGESGIRSLYRNPYPLS
jgi:hypothetical protein